MKTFRRMICVMLALACSGCVSALAGTLTLPKSLKVIEKEAFYGDRSLDYVYLPEGLERIEARAFMGSSLWSINLPESLYSIADDALPGPGQVSVSAKRGTYAYDWAVENGYIEDLIENVLALAVSKLGTPYAGGTGYKTRDPQTFDCSGFVFWCYYYGANIKLKDSSSGQGADNTYPKITDKNALVRGDVVCFHSDRSTSTTCSHTGIYMGDGLFIHAATGSSYKVVITDINSDYYTRNFLWARRIIQ